MANTYPEGDTAISEQISRDSGAPKIADERLSIWPAISRMPKMLIAFLGALAAAVAPMTEAIQGYWQNKLKAKELEHKIVLDFLDRVTSNEIDPGERKQVLEILAEIEENPLKTWAASQVIIANKKIDSARKFQQEHEQKLNNMKVQSKEYEAQGRKIDVLKQRINGAIDAQNIVLANELQIKLIDEQTIFVELSQSVEEASSKVSKVAQEQESLIAGTVLPKYQEKNTLSKDIINKVDVSIVSKMFPFTPVSNIQANFHFIKRALIDYGLTDKDMVLTVFATIRAETESFMPVSEGMSRFNTSPGGQPFDLYDARRDLGNQGKPDGETFKGRGYFQLTGRLYYGKYGAAIGLQDKLINNPELAQDPEIAARILVYAIKERESAIREAILSGNLMHVRRLVNGGSHGLDRFADAFSRGTDFLN